MRIKTLPPLLSTAREPPKRYCSLPPGEVTLDDFIAFAKKKTWGHEAPAAPFNALLTSTANEPTVQNASAGPAGGVESNAVPGVCSDSDGENAR